MAIETPPGWIQLTQIVWIQAPWEYSFFILIFQEKTIRKLITI
jgi:hypothetical protein